MAKNNFDFVDIYIGYKGHPKYNDTQLIVDDLVRMIVQKYEMIIFTTKGELIGEPDFGADLLKYLHQTKVSAKYIEKLIYEQIVVYIPELVGISYTLDISFDQHPYDFIDVMLIDFKINEYEVNIYLS